LCETTAAAPQKSDTKKAKKATKGSTPKKSKTPSNHPKYLDMAISAITALKERNGSSRQALHKYILSHFNVGHDPKAVNSHLKMALKRGVATNKLKHVKGQGASGSFKLAEKATKAPAAKKRKAPAKPKEKKEKKPKKASNPKKKSASPKKSAKAKKAPAKKATAAAAAAPAPTPAKAPTAPAPKKEKKAKKVKTPSKPKPKAAKKSPAKKAKPASPKKKAPKKAAAKK
jgi:histone H1/5